MIRAFIALPLPGDAVRRLEALQHGLDIAREVPGENMHLTLAFLGEQPQAVLRELAAELDGIRAARIDVRLSGVTLLGGKQPRAIAVSVDGGAALVALQKRVTRVAEAVGIALARRRFRPHVTLFRMPARLGAGDEARIQRWINATARFEAITFEARELALFRSVLTKDGPVYDVLEDYPLGKGDN